MNYCKQGYMCRAIISLSLPNSGSKYGKQDKSAFSVKVKLQMAHCILEFCIFFHSVPNILLSQMVRITRQRPFH